MQYTYELFEVEDGYGYDIIYDFNVLIHQEYEPSLSGYVVMTKEVAEENAKEVIKRLVGEE